MTGRTRLAATVAVAALLTACAKRPESIPAAKTETEAYERASCDSLRVRRAEIEADLNALAAAQRGAANADAVGVLLLALPISSMAGNDREAQVAIAKGRLDAIKIVQVRKGCS
ncbi:MAG: hypothetical protein OXH79_11575 [Boseongicola sp.]|nr:hypothetical protein [Boseongicola sp.]